MKKKSKPAAESKKVTLDRALSKLGLASRTQARQWIREGQVQVFRQVERNPDRWLDWEHIQTPGSIEIQNQTAQIRPKSLWMMYKPKGYLTTRHDPQGRPTVVELLPPQLHHLLPVGRLDQATSGLLLFTNDTPLAAWLTDPQTQIPRIYLVTVRGEVQPPLLASLTRGIIDQGETLRLDSAEIQKSSKKETHLVVKLTEGKNREIRRSFLSLGHEVTRLKRVQFGPWVLDELQPGQMRPILANEFRRHFPHYPLTLTLLDH